MIALLQRLRYQGLRYVRSFRWLVGESLRVSPRTWLRLLGATALNLASNAAIAGVLYAYVSMLQRDLRQTAALVPGARA